MENEQEKPKELDRDKLELKLVEFKKKINRTLTSSQYFFFNLMLHRFSWKIDFNCGEECLGYIRFRNIDINEIENGSIYISGWVLDREDFTAKNLLFILVHELLHIIFLHGPRTQGRDRYIWNLAADQVINSMIRRNFKNQNDIFPYKGYGKDGGCICYDSIGNNKVDDPSLTVEQIYDIFMENRHQWKVENLGSKNGITTYRFTDQKTGESFTVDVNDSDTETKNAIERFSRGAGEIYNSFKSRGSGSGGFFEIFDEFFKTELPWDKILENIIRKSITMKPNSRGWQTLNKYFYPLGYTLPGVVYDPEERIDTGIVSIDTSGSISNEELQKFANVLVEACDYFLKVIMICHDDGITQIETFMGSEKERLKEFIMSVGFKGRGGTSHNEVFDKIQEFQNESYEGISLYLALTDGYSNIDEHWSRNQWSAKNEISTCFVLTEHSTIPEICKDKTKHVKHVIIKN